MSIRQCLPKSTSCLPMSTDVYLMSTALQKRRTNSRKMMTKLGIFPSVHPCLGNINGGVGETGYSKWKMPHLPLLPEPSTVISYGRWITWVRYAPGPKFEAESESGHGLFLAALVGTLFHILYFICRLKSETAFFEFALGAFCETFPQWFGHVWHIMDHGHTEFQAQRSRIVFSTLVCTSPRQRLTTGFRH